MLYRVATNARVGTSLDGGVDLFLGGHLGQRMVQNFTYLYGGDYSGGSAALP
jgi:hypothetical protein